MQGQEQMTGMQPVVMLVFLKRTGVFHWWVISIISISKILHRRICWGNQQWAVAVVAVVEEVAGGGNFGGGGNNFNVGQSSGISKTNAVGINFSNI